MRRPKFHTFTLVVGSILALTIVFSQFLTPGLISPGKEIKTEQSEKESPAESAPSISIPSFSLPAPLHVKADLNFHCLFEILFESSTEEVYTSDELQYPDRLFQTMFRVIIAPNAP